jgi:hypothetical protein
MRDLVDWSSKLRVGGMILVHDYDSVYLPDVKIAVDDFLNKNLNYYMIPDSSDFKLSLIVRNN